jgi:hypothetical protein
MALTAIPAAAATIVTQTTDDQETGADEPSPTVASEPSIGAHFSTWTDYGLATSHRAVTGGIGARGAARASSTKANAAVAGPAVAGAKAKPLAPPATWALATGGLGLIGLAMRRRRRKGRVTRLGYRGP